ncbi:hypothetical protein CVT24_001190 [Panaeolus cyanescens]|uniref:Uncharacterized protein n=1 Tax=Panaeolus cyanescens TaxID=181874 RepID=A0A409W6W1_9AGAR|nr:hypothetical protein CVT24_001190 [Panaeolus cyanescens]
MKFFTATAVLFGATVSLVSAAPIEHRFMRRAVDPSLVPEFGIQPGQNPTGTGDCDGSLNANVDAGHAVNNPSVPVSFPDDNSKASQLTRMQAALVTLQNLNGPGVGCPAASTTFLAQQEAIQNGPDTPAPAPPPPAAPPAPQGGGGGGNGGGNGGGVDPNLVPDLGHQAGVNPTGTGDCDGAVNGPDGNPIKIPCSCPPDRDAFIQAVSANVAAGHAVNNPGISVSFPTGDSKEDQLARIQTSLVTLQNLQGPGVGCPAAATTLLAQQAAIQNS